MFGTKRFATEADDAIRKAIDETGWVDEPVIAAGQLRQGKAPSMLQMITGAAVVEVLRPRRSKLLPRHFIMAATESKVVAFKATGGKGETASVYTVSVDEDIAATFPRGAVRITDLPEGPKSKGGIMEVNGERFPVARPNLNGEPSTDALLALLSA